MCDLPGEDVQKPGSDGAPRVWQLPPQRGWSPSRVSSNLSSSVSVPREVACHNRRRHAELLSPLPRPLPPGQRIPSPLEEVRREEDNLRVLFHNNNYEIAYE